ncbi:MAG: hypothetical protein A2283_16860 [Lentisphaerae bacterium RIFOXYA12_FULL_48_11]|nr:MAG: hypothetical protein A2283_16860 [Lentisphaerae bacterium RIFOXYA12_FULL_48_11]
MTFGKLYTEENYKEILRQIELGILVCPVTKRKLKLHNSELLKTEGGEYTYKFLFGKLPVLIADDKLVDEYAKSSEQMNLEYTLEYLQKKKIGLIDLEGTIIGLKIASERRTRYSKT